MNECWIIMRKESSSFVTLPFSSRDAAQQHLDGLGVGEKDNARLVESLVIRRFVAAEDIAGNYGVDIYDENTEAL
jgi:hypothetical protein